MDGTRVLSAGREAIVERKEMKKLIKKISMHITNGTQTTFIR